MENTYKANIGAFLRGAAKDGKGWHQFINHGEYAFILALREGYFPSSDGLQQVKLLFQKGDEKRNQDPSLLYLEEVEFPSSMTLKNIALDSKGERITIMQHLQNRAGKFGMQFVEPDDQRLSTATNPKSINLAQKGDNYVLGNGGLARLTNKVLEGHIDFTSRRIGVEMQNKPLLGIPPIQNYKNFLEHLLEVAGIENSFETAELVVQTGEVRGITNRETALEKATEHAKQIIPQTKMYKTEKFELDGQNFEIPKPVQKAMPKWVATAATALTALAANLGSQGKGS